MGRPREFNEVEAVEAAMGVFWDKGYEAAALPDLLQAMNLTRGSFYKAFKSKHAIYLQALRHYNTKAIVPIVAALLGASGREGRKCIHNLFLKIEKIAKSKISARGCFLCKAAIDRAPHDKEVAREVRSTIKALEKGFAFALSPDVKAKEKAAQLTGTYLGIQVLRNAHNSVDTISSIVRRTVDDVR